jgi:predicted nucleic acid-binding protein
MTKYLLDTNVILRFSNPADAQNTLATEAVAILLAQGDECYLTAQVLIELWVVATRPLESNGLGWQPKQAYNVISQLLDRFPTAEDTPLIFDIWLALVAEYQIKGKRTHDIRIVAAMKASKISHILTLNPKDFSGIADITVVHPQEILDKTSFTVS